MSTHATAKCPKCGTLLEIPIEGDPEGKRIRCGSCRGVFVLRHRASDGPTPASPRATPRAPIAAGENVAATPPAALGAETTARASPTAPSPARPWRFEVGDDVAGRYRVVRHIARGGMGEVYEVEDHELGGRVALKTIRPEMADEQWSVGRFRREIQLARQVTHPNVCRIFDVSYHEAGERVVFLTMELLAGETLAERLARDGPLPPDRALILARQLASALDAAHGAGVIHRDFKSNNVMLVPLGASSAETSEGGVGIEALPAERLRAVVTDFGLARGAGDGGLAATLALDGVSLGTPDYLAPEQVEGGEITPAADVYAFGLVLYEMVTGRLPFSGDTALATAVKRVREDAPSPRTHVPELDAGWERAILGCLERDPADRFTTAGEALRSMGSAQTGGEGGAAAGPSAAVRAETRAVVKHGRKSERHKVALLVALVLVAVAVAVYQIGEWRARSHVMRQVLGLPADQPLVTRRTVAVLGLDNLSGDPDSDWLGTAVAEMLRTELRAGEDLRPISGDDVARMEAELGLGSTGAAGTSDDGEGRRASGSAGAGLTDASLQRIRRATGADYVVAGSYTVLGEAPGRRIRLDLQLRDAVKGETLASVAETGTETELFELVTRAGEELRRRLGAEDRGGRPGLLQRAALPATPKAARLYSEGLDEMRRFEPLAAKERFERAAEIEPGHPLIHSALALAWSALGYEARSREEIERALELADSLPQEERLSIEARSLETLRDWKRAVETWRNLWALAPDNIEYGIRLAQAQLHSDRPGDALTTIAALRTLPPPTGEDPRIDLAEATVAAALGEPDRQLEAASQAASKGREQGLRLLVAQARLAECNALWRSSRPGEARAACEESREIFADRGDRAGEAAALNTSAGVLYDQGDLDGARELYERSLDTHREMGNQGAVATVLNNLAVVVRNQGDLAGARDRFEEALELFGETGNPEGEATTLTNLAPLLTRVGELTEAARRLDRALEIRRDSPDRRGEAATLDQSGVVLRRQGRLAESRQRHLEALRLGRELGSRRREAVSLDHLAETELARGDLEEARRRFEEALALSRELGYRSLEASSVQGLAKVRFEQGDLDTAREHQRQALALREELGERGEAAEGRTVLARLLLESGDTEEAETLARGAVEAFAAQGAADREALALTVLASTLRAQGRSVEAREVVRRASERLLGSEALPVRLATELEAARLQALGTDGGADGDLEGALERLGRAAAAARQAGLVGLELEARLARVEVTSGQRETLETGFDAELLASDARSRDFERLARAAERLAAGTPAMAPAAAP